ncbi:hypothetical protein TMatcc_001468 [Talaromyces marneffei ATCC 18224]|uniref:uncharacterized protein n=1 Tax=Talaromyces marneffei TaxID=37727 RepID=UPI0012AA5B90|nr:uncharacterized protein EYB26_007299 [Talaromyces marneffei]KAE8551517.1 hypothetical protein EYB25_005407 [Talaromyces marneffei]QGA19610.1 hypothetical protein EYB26_007299 [Talaromyces marneffei]
MSDTEQEWKPNPRRPQSTMAQAFSLALDSAFMLDNEVNDLTQSIELKKQRMTIQTRELEALQARIREAEELLQQEQAEKAAAKNGDNNTLHGTDQEGRDSDTSAATSHDMDEHEEDGNGKPRA